LLFDWLAAAIAAGPSFAAFVGVAAKLLWGSPPTTRQVLTKLTNNK
jgi:hypothetical protein